MSQPEIYKIVAPDGQFLVIPQELWWAMQSFQKSPTRPCGKVTVHYKDGNIAGVDGDFSKKFK